MGINFGPPKGDGFDTSLGSFSFRDQFRNQKFSFQEIDEVAKTLCKLLKAEKLDEVMLVSIEEPSFDHAVKNLDVQLSAASMLKKLIEQNDWHHGETIKKKFDLSTELTNAALLDAITGLIKQGEYDIAAIRVSQFGTESFELPREHQETICAKIGEFIKKGKPARAVELLGKFKMDDDLLEIHKKDATKSILKCIIEEDFKIAGALRYDFQITAEEIGKELLKQRTIPAIYPTQTSASFIQFTLEDLTDFIFSSKATDANLDNIFKFLKRSERTALEAEIGKRIDSHPENAKKSLDSLFAASSRFGPNFQLKLRTLVDGRLEITKDNIGNLWELASASTSITTNKTSALTLEKISKSDGVLKFETLVELLKLTRHGSSHEVATLSWAALAKYPMPTTLQYRLLNRVRLFDGLTSAKASRILATLRDNGTLAFNEPIGIGETYASILSQKPAWLTERLLGETNIETEHRYMKGFSYHNFLDKVPACPPHLRIVLYERFRTGNTFEEFGDTKAIPATNAFLASLKRSTEIRELTLALSEPSRSCLLSRALTLSGLEDLSLESSRMKVIESIKLISRLRALNAVPYNPHYLERFKTLDKLRLFLEKTERELQADLFGNRNIARNLKKIGDYWGTIEPVMTYANRLKGMGNTETLAHLSTWLQKLDPPSYKQYYKQRYDLGNPTIKNQIGHLNADQRKVWIEEHALDISKLARLVESKNKPKEILDILKTYFTTQNGNAHFTFSDITKLYVMPIINSDSDESSKIKKREKLQEIQSTTQTIDKLLASNEIPRLSEALEILRNPSQHKAKSVGFAQEFATKYLSSTDLSSLSENIKNNSYGEFGALTSSSAKALEFTIQEMKRGIAEAKESNIWYTWNIDRDKPETQSQLRQLRKELAVAESVIHIASITPARIVHNRLISVGKSNQRELSHTLSQLENQIKHPAFSEAVKEIFKVIQTTNVSSLDERIVAFETHNPQIMLQIGKYPIGNGSCQNYESTTGHNSALLGYVNGARVKAQLLIDRSKLSAEVQKQIEQVGLLAALQAANPQEILKATMARAIIKLGATQSNEPRILLLPTYTNENKRDQSMSHLMQVFSTITYNRGNASIPIRRYTDKEKPESEKLQFKKSGNPGGEYEDSGGTGVMKIDYWLNTIPLDVDRKFDKFDIDSLLTSSLA